MKHTNKKTTDLIISIKKLALSHPYQLAGLAVCSTLLSLIFGALLLTHSNKTHFDESVQYPLLSKRVFQENPNDVIINFVPLRKALRQYVVEQNNTVGVYFEYLPSGISIGANDREEVKLASLSKVPLVMSVLKKVERGELKLDDKLVLKKKDLNDKFGDLWKEGEGATFTIQELIEVCLKKSDNTAYYMLFDLLTDAEIIEVYENLEIEVSSKESEPEVSPKSYSSIFRSLYLSSYLSEVNSNYILKILSETIFTDKIPAGVPANIPISHKIGVFSRADSPDKVFTDCGIIYIPERPYVLCVFVQGDDAQAKKDISYISKMVFGYVQIVKGGNDR